MNFLTLGMVYMKRGIPIGEALDTARIDLAYCLDATEVILSGSCFYDKFGPGEDDWLAMESYSLREKEGA
jgi:hypothetical protein